MTYRPRAAVTLGKASRDSRSRWERPARERLRQAAAVSEERERNLYPVRGSLRGTGGHEHPSGDGR